MPGGDGAFFHRNRSAQHEERRTADGQRDFPPVGGFVAEGVEHPERFRRGQGDLMEVVEAPERGDRPAIGGPVEYPEMVGGGGAPPHEFGMGQRRGERGQRHQAGTAVELMFGERMIPDRIELIDQRVTRHELTQILALQVDRMGQFVQFDHGVEGLGDRSRSLRFLGGQREVGVLIHINRLVSEKIADRRDILLMAEFGAVRAAVAVDRDDVHDVGTADERQCFQEREVHMGGAGRHQPELRSRRAQVLPDPGDQRGEGDEVGFHGGRRPVLRFVVDFLTVDEVGVHFLQFEESGGDAVRLRRRASAASAAGTPHQGRGR